MKTEKKTKKYLFMVYINNYHNQKIYFPIVTNSNYIIENIDYGRLAKHKQMFCEFTRKSKYRNESRTQPIFKGDCFEILKQLDYNTKPTNIDKYSNLSKSSLKNLNPDYTGKHFFKHSISHLIRINGGVYEKHIIHI